MTHDSWLVTCYPWLQDLFWFISLMTTMTLWWLINLWLMTHDSWLMTRDSWLTYDSRLKTQDLWLLMKLTLRRFIIDCELWFLMTHDSWLSWLDFYFRLIWPYELMKTNNPLWDSILLIINYDLILMVQNEMMDMTDSYGSYGSYDSWKTQTWLDSTWLVHANVLILMYINLYLCNWIQWFWVATPCINYLFLSGSASTSTAMVASMCSTTPFKTTRLPSTRTLRFITSSWMPDASGSPWKLKTLHWNYEVLLIWYRHVL